MPLRARAPRLLAAALAASLLAASCSGDDDDAAVDDDPTSTTVADTTSTVVDHSRVSLAPVQGNTTTTMALGPGRATLQGVVAGPDGPVPGAVVRVERLVGDAIAVADVATGADGRWLVERVLGGRYRVRAWLAPELAMAEPTIFFLEATESRTVDLRVERFVGAFPVAVTDPDPPVAGRRASVGVRLVSRVVDQQGVVRTRPLPGVEVGLSGGGRWIVHSDNPVVTDGSGNVAWSVTCRSAGRQPLAIVLDGDDVVPLGVADCVEPEAPSTTTTAQPSTSSTTSSTSPSSTSSTTTTTEAD